MISPSGTRVVGKKGRSGRKSISEEIVNRVKEKTFKEMMKKMLPDKLLLEKHLELLTVPLKIRTKTIKRGDEIEMEEIEQVDSQAIGKGLDMAYKLKGEYAAEKKEISGSLKIEDLLN